MKKSVKHLILLLLCACGVFWGEIPAEAADYTIVVNPDDLQNISLYIGDTGRITPNPTVTPPQQIIMGYDEYGNPIYGEDTKNQINRFEYTLEEDYWENSHCMTVNADGTFTANTTGSETVTVTGYNGYGYSVFSATIYVTVRLDMTNVTLGKSSVKGYLFPSYSYGDYVYYEETKLEIPVNSTVVLNDEMEGVDLSCKSSNKKVSVSASLSNNVLQLNVSAQKKCKSTITVTIGGKKFKIALSLNTVGISANSYLLEKNHSKKLKITGYSGKVTWSSTNSKIASVSNKGVVKGKTIGNAVITAKIGEQRIGCAVSVTTSSLKKVCARATYIGTHWTYSQAKRTQSGYYDCSALVWKAYKQYTSITFGSAGYPGTTVTESAWCKTHNRMIKGGYSYKKIEKMQMNPGDIVFKSTDLNKPYSTTYHVEMFTGYTCQGYDSKGKPIVSSLWAARGAGYGAEEGSLLARPMK